MCGTRIGLCCSRPFTEPGVVSSTGLQLSVAQASWPRTRDPTPVQKEACPGLLVGREDIVGLPAKLPCAVTAQPNSVASNQWPRAGTLRPVPARGGGSFDKTPPCMGCCTARRRCRPIPPLAATRSLARQAQLTARGRLSSSPSTTMRGWQTWSDSSLPTDTR
jgi:hypothetical protein